MGRNREPGSFSVDSLISSARTVARTVARLEFGPPVACVYNPLAYAWSAHECYLRACGAAPKRVVFLGMNPGPFGMVQTGIPFGDVAVVRSWLKIECAIGKPRRQHPRRPVLGFACTRSEVSGQRLWGLFAARFGDAREFFRDHIVLNYCPLAFVEASGRNRTPDKLPAGERERLFAACDEYLRVSVLVLQPQWLIAVGDFAFKRVRSVFAHGPPKLGRIPHPSPASPAANRNWAALALAELERLGVWPRQGGNGLR